MPIAEASRCLLPNPRIPSIVPRRSLMTTIDRKKLHQLHERESQRFVSDHPNSAALYQPAQSSLLGGVPMHWMKKRPLTPPPFTKPPNDPHPIPLPATNTTPLSLPPP